tara:strand:+ start:203 stop:550 length:348 start_codon:yes stop_codon:yes gene_type:complete
MVPKYIACNNCGVTHKVIDVCKTEIITNRDDEIMSQVTKEDLKYSMPSSLYELLESYSRGVHDFEHAQFIIDNERWEEFIVLKREEVEDSIQGKLVRFKSADKFVVETFLDRRAV